MTLAAVMTQVATVEAGIAGIKRAFDTAERAINDLPCFVNFPDAGGPIQRSPGMVRETVHRIKLLLYVTAIVLPSAEAELRPYLDLTLNAFDAKITLNGAAANSRITGYKYGGMAYGGHDYLGIAFDLEVTERNVVTLTQ